MAESPVWTGEEVLGSTATHMLDVAERLFAESSIDKVSLREIVRASGQSNLSAAHYHFGSREALIGALLARRIRVINQNRHQRLDTLVANGRDGNIHALVVESTLALASAVREQPWGVNYVRVVAQVLCNPQLFMARHLDEQTMSGHIRFVKMLRPLLAHVPPRVFKDRISILNNQTVFGMARWVHLHGAVTASNRRRFDALVHNLADFMAAGVAAPIDSPSDQTAEHNEEQTTP
jgi:AcrR family transcriptional regulator